MISFQIFNTKVEVDGSILLLFIAAAASGQALFVVMTFIFSILHEFIHYMTASLFNYKSEKIAFGIFGGILYLKESFIKPVHELLIHVSGPLSNLIIAFVLINIYKTNHSDIIKDLIFINIILGAFNLLPFYPLDGGKIIRLYISFFLGYGRALKITTFFSGLFSFFLLIFGIYLVQYNLVNLLICAAAANIYFITRHEKSYIFYKIIKNIDESSRLHNQSKIIVCKTNMKIIKLLETYNPLHKRIFTVVNEKGNYRGQLSESDILNGIYNYGIYTDLDKLTEMKRRKEKFNGNTKENRKHSF